MIFKYLCVAFLFTLVMGAIIGCGPGEPIITNDYHLAVHEWGVLVGCASDSSYVFTSRPEIASVIREPVIYFHSEGVDTMKVEAIFKTGHPSLTWPEAAILGDTVRWDPVTFAPPPVHCASADTGDLVPLEEIIHVLNNVDADQLYYGGQTSRFLFYEGMIPYNNEVMVNYDYDSSWVVAHNQSSRTVYQVGVSLGNIIMAPKVFNFDSLVAGQTDTVYTSTDSIALFSDGLVPLGFTQKEADAFGVLWNGALSPSQGSAGSEINLMYRISQDAYEDLIELRVDPAPTEILRALFVLVHIE